ncbi:MAG: hypothetical protein LBQ31_08185, partial [Bacteroidales bacterium]|nr:hypothetical protein [Bacteroidales bacterium]
MDDIYKIIDSVFSKHKLLGNYDCTESEYALMVDLVSDLCNKLIHRNIHFSKESHKLIFITLVEIAKRWKNADTVEDHEEDRFWDFIFKTLVDGKEDKLYREFRSMISQLGSKNILPIVKTGKIYYATLMMHSFAPKNSMQSFFELCYNVFKKDLDFGFTSDDEWICEIVARQMKSVLDGGYREDKQVSIGTSAYSIRIGLRSFALHDDLSANFVEFIKNTLHRIHKLYNGENISEDTRLERCIVDWWRKKSEMEKLPAETVRKKRVSTVSKQNIVAKYIRNDDKVFLCIPSIRLDDDNNTMSLTVYTNGEQVLSEEMQTKRREFIVATKPREFELNELLEYDDSINVRIEIKENEIVIFDSEKNKTTSLKREFILFDGEKEIFSQINKLTNYFVYSKDIDTLKSAPTELTTYGENLYNIYPNAGESLIGEIKKVFFVNKEKAASLGNNACLIGNLTDVEWSLDDISCAVYNNIVKLMVPENLNLKALELRIDRKSY